MKKYLLSAAVVAAMGAGSLYGYRTMNPNDGLSDAQLANIEALSELEIELGEVEILCDYPSKGRCWIVKGGVYYMCGEAMFLECEFHGNQTFYCTTPC